VDGHADTVAKLERPERTISKPRTVRVKVNGERGDLLLEAVQYDHPDALLELVIPAERKNNAYNLEELILICALNLEAQALGIPNNVEYVLERLGRPRTDYKNVQRRIRKAQWRFKSQPLFRSRVLRRFCNPR
jgi:hypothetical protein